MSDTEVAEKKNRRSYTMSAAARGQKTAALKAAREKEKENRQMVKSFLDMVNKNKGKKKPETSDDEAE